MPNSLAFVVCVCVPQHTCARTSVHLGTPLGVRSRLLPSLRLDFFLVIAVYNSSLAHEFLWILLSQAPIMLLGDLGATVPVFNMGSGD